MRELFLNLKPFYEKLLQRGLSYGLSHQEIHENSLLMFVKFLSLFYIQPWDTLIDPNNTLNSYSRKIRLLIHSILFQEEQKPLYVLSQPIFPVLKEIIRTSHIEKQLKEALTPEEWDALVEFLLTKNWCIYENFKDMISKEETISPEFLSYFYETVLDEYEKLFSLKSTPKLSKRKNKGIFYTPWRIIRDITDSCLDQYSRKNNKIDLSFQKSVKILDPSCGTGSFLVYAAESLFNRIKKIGENDSFLPIKIVENCIYGVDVALSSIVVAKIRLLCWIVNRCDCDLNLLPSCLLINIQQGNSLFGTYINHFRYPLNYSSILSRIKSYINLESMLKSNNNIIIGENWIIASLQLKEMIKDGKIPSDKFPMVEKAKNELIDLNNFFYYNLFKRKLEKSSTNKRFKEKDIGKINLFHWGVAFPEVIIQRGFDIIVGNPPYGRSVLTHYEKSLIKLFYKSCSGHPKKYSLNAASAFIERSISILKPNGILGLIVPFSVLRVEEFESLRKFILEKTTINSINDESNAFSEVTLEMCSLFLIKDKKEDYNVIITPRNKVMSKETIPVSVFKKYKRFMIYFDDLWEKVTQRGMLGTISGDYGIDHRIVNKDLVNEQTTKYRIPFLHSGRCVSEYGLNPKYFQWSKAHPSNRRFSIYYREPRLINTAIGNKFRVAYKPEKIIPGTNVSILEISPSYHYFPMLILLNSDIVNYLLKRYVLNFSRLTVYLHKYYTKLIPIIYPKNFEEEYRIFASYLIFLSQSNLFNKIKMRKRYEYLKNLANYLVYDLYFPEILKSSSSLPDTIGKFLKPIEINSFIDLIFENYAEKTSENRVLARIIESNAKIIISVTNNLRSSEMIRKFKKTIYTNKMVQRIRDEL